eukprot:4114229-Prymnesium_polylepis.2
MRCSHIGERRELTCQRRQSLAYHCCRTAHNSREHDSLKSLLPRAKVLLAMLEREPETMRLVRAHGRSVER